jgi:hypothetical protein
MHGARRVAGVQLLVCNSSLERSDRSGRSVGSFSAILESEVSSIASHYYDQANAIKKPTGVSIFISLSTSLTEGRTVGLQRGGEGGEWGFASNACWGLNNIARKHDSIHMHVARVELQHGDQQATDTWIDESAAESIPEKISALNTAAHEIGRSPRYTRTNRFYTKKLSFFVIWLRMVVDPVPLPRKCLYVFKHLVP